MNHDLIGDRTDVGSARSGTVFMMPSVRVLPGLPPYGAPPEPFSSTGLGSHREGFVVEFVPDDGPTWVGNFQHGSTSFDVVLVEPGMECLIVIAGGEAYVVEPNTRACVRTFGGQIEQVFIPSPNTVVFSNGLWVEALGPSGLLWRSRRVTAR
jgi:hypothetical protein